MKKIHRHRTLPGLALLSILGALSGCAVLQIPDPPLPQELIAHSLKIYPLPGALDETPVLHSNNPERIETSGLLISTLPAQDLNQPRKLNVPLQGDFRLFIHHVARTAILSQARIWLAVVADNPSQDRLNLELKRGNLFRTWPEAPFLPLTGIRNNSEAKHFSGPGDRLALASLRGENLLGPRSFLLPGKSRQTLLLEAIPTNPLWVLQQDNALSALLEFSCAQPVHLSVLAWVSADGQPPRTQDLDHLLETGQAAGPAEAPVTEYNPSQAPSGGSFRYGRVAGLSQGAVWNSELNPLPEKIGEKIGFPLSSVYLKRLSTSQNQSATLIARVPGTAIQSHGNYGVHYQLKAHLHNPDAEARRYAVYLHHPLQIRISLTEDPVALFRLVPDASVTFRGSLRLRWDSEEYWLHQVLHSGEAAPALKILELPAGENRSLQLDLVYPPDATPPQLLEIERLS